jgi:hypothetical protein
MSKNTGYVVERLLHPQIITIKKDCFCPLCKKNNYHSFEIKVSPLDIDKFWNIIKELNNLPDTKHINNGWLNEKGREKINKYLAKNKKDEQLLFILIKNILESD